MNKFLFLKKKTNDEIQTELREVYMGTLHRLHQLSNIGQLNSDAVAKTFLIMSAQVTTPGAGMIEKILDMVLADRRVKVREIAKAVEISIDRVHNILQNHLGMEKLSARWVPRLLTAHKRISV